MAFETKMKRLEEIVQQMESGELKLENSLSLFEEGVKLAKELHSQLSDSEQKVKLLVGQSENGTEKTTEFVADKNS
ncbi:MAG: exodeoxyribonuclease VII small subunit [Bdellovibrionales bacterium CG10_big_fil_rev_8_21_14_0_10_45_34]|nr:MAG: exodeoxyribonuclease VII small subunit [Bdellovibrionales bacterium CG10_big_fil_rev_8_21_14_0_10_45_34]